MSALSASSDFVTTTRDPGILILHINLEAVCCCPPFHSCPFNPVHFPPNSQMKLPCNVTQIPSLPGSTASDLGVTSQAFSRAAEPCTLCLPPLTPSLLSPLLTTNQTPGVPFFSTKSQTSPRDSRVPAHLAPSIRNTLPMLTPHSPYRSQLKCHVV